MTSALGPVVQYCCVALRLKSCVLPTVVGAPLV